MSAKAVPTVATLVAEAEVAEVLINALGPERVAVGVPAARNVTVECAVSVGAASSKPSIPQQLMSAYSSVMPMSLVRYE